MKFAQMIEDLREFAQTATLKELFDELMLQSGYDTSLSGDPETCDERRENLRELSSNLLKYSEENPDGDLSGFLEEVALMTDIDNYDESADSVVMMTLHASKGLEFPVVFIPGMEEGIFPGHQSMYSEEDVEEERRLAYVGITRAKRKLFISHANSRMLFGTTQRNLHSRFVIEIPDALTERTGRRPASQSPFEAQGRGDYDREDRSSLSGNGYLSRSRAQITKKPAPASTETYAVGDTVMHKVFGKGVVVSAKPMANDFMLEIAFEGGSTKKLMANFAKLQKLK
jgi:DNA helicase-2/ATP-dependent DNA helicase PcrA